MILEKLWPTRNGHKPIPNFNNIVHESEQAYLAKSQDHLDGEQLGDFRDDPFLFRKREQKLVPPKTPRNDLVDVAAQTCILLGQAEFQSQYILGGPVDPGSGKPYGKYSREYEHWAAEQAKPVLTAEMAATIEQMEYGFRAHRGAQELLAEGVAHRVARCHYGGVRCQTRIDWLNPTKGIVAVTACDRLKYFECRLSATPTVHELAFQRALLAQVAEAEIPVHIIVVEKHLPHRCGVWSVSEALLRKAQEQNEQALSQLVECRETGHWPTGYESIRTLTTI